MTQYPQNRWQTTDDAVLNCQRRQFTQQRNQAQWRKEQWQLEWEEWLELWLPEWHRRGRTRDSVCMSRRDRTGPWHRDNVEIIPRSESIRRQHQDRLDK